MTKQKLEEYRSIKDEIEELKARENTKLTKRLMRECRQIESFIDGIMESETRRIFRMAYIDGKTFAEIAEIMHVDRSTVGKRINNYLARSGHFSD